MFDELRIGSFELWTLSIKTFLISEFLNILYLYMNVECDAWKYVKGLKTLKLSSFSSLFNNNNNNYTTYEYMIISIMYVKLNNIPICWIIIISNIAVNIGMRWDEDDDDGMESDIS